MLLLKGIASAVARLKICARTAGIKKYKSIIKKKRKKSLASMVYKFFDKKSFAEAIECEIILNQYLVEELH